MKPVDAHLTRTQKHGALTHLLLTLFESKYTLAFATTALLATGGHMLMPFGSAYTVHNVGLSLGDLPTIYLISGLCRVFTGPLIGKAADRFGKFRTFFFGTLVTCIQVAIWTNLGAASLISVIIINVVLFVGIFSRMIPAQALMSAVPDISRRGAFNAIGSSLQQFSGGIASVIAGAVIVQNDGGPLQHFNWLGYIVMTTAVISLILMRAIHRRVTEPGPA
jgi:predicted MFS family arabinose efflux permease